MIDDALSISTKHGRQPADLDDENVLECDVIRAADL
jgi:hypothetical protein